MWNWVSFTNLAIKLGPHFVPDLQLGTLSEPVFGAVVWGLLTPSHRVLGALRPCQNKKHVTLIYGSITPITTWLPCQCIQSSLITFDLRSHQHIIHISFTVSPKKQIFFPQDGAPPVISWFIFPLSIDISTTSPSYWSYKSTKTLKNYSSTIWFSNGYINQAYGVPMVNYSST